MLCESLSAAALDDVHGDIDADEEQNAARENGVHGTDRDVFAEEGEVAVHAVADTFHHRVREAL